MVPVSLPWHATSPEAIWAELECGATGLSSTEASGRLCLDGPNQLPEPPTSSLPLPLLPVQLLLLHLVTNGIQGLALAFERLEGEVLQQRPRRRGKPCLTAGAGPQRTAVADGAV